MSIAALTTGQQTVTGTGPVTPTTGLDISGVTGDCTVHVRVQGLSAASGKASAAITLEDSVNAFTASVPVKEIQAQSTVEAQAEQHFIFRKYELPTCRFGTASAVLRVNAVALTGTTPSLTLDAWLED
jgi:hypothetical protein